MVDFEKLLKALRSFIEEIAPALAVMLWNYTESKNEELKNEARKAKTDLQMELNHEKVDKENAGKSDADILHAAIDSDESKSGGGQSGCGDQGTQSTSANGNSGNGLGQRKA